MIKVIILNCCITITQAASLGVQGALYPIVESDMLTSITQRLEDLDKRGVLIKEQHALVQRTLRHILMPPAAPGVKDLPLDQGAHKRTFNPTVILNHDLYASRKLFAKKGLRINPLKSRPWQGCLVFINADNRQQLQWASKHPCAEPFKIVLTQGNIKQASKFLGKRVYFDQQGRLVSVC